MRLEPTPNAEQQLEQHLANLNDNDFILVTSTQAASQAKAIWDAHPPADLSRFHCFAVGSSSAAILSDYADFLHPDTETSEALWEMIEQQHFAKSTTPNASQRPEKQQVLMLKGEGGRKFLKSALQQVRCLVVECNMYQRQITLPNVDSTHWQHQNIDCIVVTSGELLQAAFQYFPESWLLSRYWIVVSERMAELAKSLGIKHVLVSRAANDSALLEAVRQFPEGKHD